MKIVIDIEDELYQMCKDLLGDADPIERAIAGGTPLPKGHGRLIDADELDRKMKAYNSGRGFYYSGLPYVHTIIGADKAESEDKDGLDI